MDNGLAGSTDECELRIFIKELESEFKITTKEACFYLAVDKERNDEFVKIHQKVYAKRILEHFHFSECTPISAPMLKMAENSQNRMKKFGEIF